MTYVFRDRIGVEVWVYLDDIYIFLKTIEEHENALEYVFNCLKREQLFTRLSNGLPVRISKNIPTPKTAY